VKLNNILPALFGGAVLLLAGTCHAASSCFFSTPLGSAVLQFGSLDPASAVDKPASPTSLQFTCTKTPGGGQITFHITESRSANYNVAPAGYKMRNTSVITEYLPYQITYTHNAAQITFPYNAKAADGVLQTINVTGNVLGTDYQNAYYGSYSDTIGFDITP